MSLRCAYLLVLLAAGLTGCVSQGTYPSLAPRPAEREDWTEEPSHPAPNVADDAALRTRIAALLGQARDGARAFEADLPATERAVAHPGPAESDSWVEAQQAISRLEASRGRSTDAVAELHQLRLARGATPTSAADLAALDAAIAEAEAIVARQQRELDRVNRL